MKGWRYKLEIPSAGVFAYFRNGIELTAYVDDMLRRGVTVEQIVITVEQVPITD